MNDHELDTSVVLRDQT